VVLATGLTVTVLAAVTLSGTAATWDATAFRQPTLHGALAYVPRLADVASFRIGTIERLRTEAADVARKLAAYYADERGLGSGEPLTDTLRVLHVTDLHLDAVGAELSERLAGAYDVSLVVDTGDIAILGTGAEAALLPSLVDTATPRIFIPGNHDSPEIVAAMRELPGVTVLASGTAEVEGLTVFGAGDPMSSVTAIDSQPEALRSATREAIARFEEGVRSGEPTPDIVALHTPAMRAPFLGKVGVVLSGHSHQARIDILKGTVAINSGTTGGMPYDSAASGKTPLPHGASVLYYSTDRPHRLLAVDLIQVNTDRTVTVTRRLMEARPTE
jgi:Icc-related predicted phosphoesterase